MYTLYDIILIGLFSLQVFYISFFFAHMLEPRYSRRMAIVVGWIVFTIFVIATYPYQHNMLLRQFFHVLAVVVICRTMYKSSWKAALFSMAMIWMIGIVCDSVVGYTIFACFPDVQDYLSGFYLLLANILYEFVFIPAVYLFLFFWKKWQSRILNKSICATFLFSVSQLFMLESFVYYITFQSIIRHCFYPRALLCSAVGIFLNILADIILFQVILADSQKERLVTQLELMNLQAGRELEYYHFINEKIQESRKLRHDFGNQLQTIYRIIQSDRMPEQEATARLSKVLEKPKGLNPSARFCENIIVNVILGEKSRMAVRQGISFKASVVLPETFFVEKVDLCSIFSNLLDNAIRAAAQVVEKRSIYVEASALEGCCMIVTVNSCGRDSEKPSATALAAGRADVRDGYGLCILRSIGEKYGGELVTQKENGLFTARLTLNQTKDAGSI